jgi:hypothetical protein
MGWERHRSTEEKEDLNDEMRKDLDASTAESSTQRVAGLDDLGVVEHVLSMARVSRSAPP